MAWNEPGGNNRDPWGGGGRNQGPPDLDEVVRKLSNKLRGLLGGKRGGDGGPKLPTTSPLGVWIIVVVVVGLWLASGIYVVDQGKRGVVLRFGKFIGLTMPGLNYHLPYPLESVNVVDVARIRAEEIGYRSGPGDSGQPALRPVPRESLMLTEDENIVDVQLSVQYQVKNPRAYLFNVKDPDQTLREVVESATREVVGKNTMDFVLTEGRSEIVSEVAKLSQHILDQYGTGLEITNVNLRDAQPPDQVQAAFADAIKAREDEQRLINEAQAYRNGVLPQARGQAARVLAEAKAYKEKTVAQAEGDAKRFEQLEGAYQKAPDITRERLYIDAMQDVLSKTSKVLIDAKNKNSNVLYLPLDRLLKKEKMSSPSSSSKGGANSSSASSAAGAGSGSSGSSSSDDNMGASSSNSDNQYGRSRDISRSRERR